MLGGIRIQGMLSFKDLNLALEPLNVVIGPNASGKSNLIDVVDFLRSAPDDVLAPLRKGGRSSEWFWRGDSSEESGKPKQMAVEAIVKNRAGSVPLRYSISVVDTAAGARIASEKLELSEPLGEHTTPYIFFDVQNGRGVVNVRDEQGSPRRLQLEDLTDVHSVLSQRKDPNQYPEITTLGKQLEHVRIYRDWNMSRDSGVRKRQAADKPNVFLDEDAGNLALVLNRLERDGTMAQVEEYMRQFYEDFRRVSIQIEAGEAQIFVRERGLRELVPATRLSDGTLRFLALLAILCHPEPPPLVCIEEPELNLHPDVVPLIAELLKNASARTQLIVTTHSEALVDALTDDVESVVVCEKSVHGGTEMRRLSSDQLEAWLDQYRLGELWRKGEIGGSRW